MADKNQAQADAQAPARADLLPAELPEGQGQRLPDAERVRLQADTRLAEARRTADEDFKAAQQRIRAEHRETVQQTMDRQRQDARRQVDAERKRLREDAGPLGALSPAYMDREAALVRVEAEAFKADETVPGGVYIVAGRHVDADGNPLD